MKIKKLNEDYNNSNERVLCKNSRGDYLIHANSGRGWTAFNSSGVCIGGINRGYDKGEAETDEQAIRMFKAGNLSENFKEDYLDSAEFRIQRYEDDIADLMYRLHDGYMNGRIYAKAYADALAKAYSIFEELDYEIEESLFDKKPHRFTIGDKIRLDNGNKGTVRANQMSWDKWLIVTDDVDNKPYQISVDDAQKMLCKEELDEGNEDEFTVGKLVTHIDDNPPKRGIIVGRKGDIATVKVGDADDYVDVNVNKLQLDESFGYKLDLDKLSWQVADFLDVDKLGEKNWIEYFQNDTYTIIGGEQGCSFEATGPNDVTKKGSLRTANGSVHVVFRNGSEARCESAEEIARFIAGEFGVSI